MSSSNEELVKEMSATRKAIALYLGRLSKVEEKVDKILKESNKPKPYVERGYRQEYDDDAKSPTLDWMGQLDKDLR